MTTDAHGRIRIRLVQSNPLDPSSYGWATSAPASAVDRAGYTVEWDDGYKDHPETRWHFEDDGLFNLEAV